MKKNINIFLVCSLVCGLAWNFLRMFVWGVMVALPTPGFLSTLLMRSCKTTRQWQEGWVPQLGGPKWNLGQASAFWAIK